MIDPRALSNERFSRFADRYVASAVHAAEEELRLLLEVANPSPGWRTADIATGGGHTARAFAPHVGRMLVTDFSLPMLEAARHSLSTAGVTNAEYLLHDAERLPYAANSLDLITCRVAAHHFPDCFRFVRECARTLKPGGVVLIQDHVLPEDARSAAYLEAFERLRDPSHHRAFSESEWRGHLLDAGLTVEHAQIIKKRAGFIEWARRQDCPPDVVVRLGVLLAQLPQIARDWIEPQCLNSPEASFCHVYIVISGRKPVG